jgi:hypothetical protein
MLTIAKTRDIFTQNSQAFPKQDSLCAISNAEISAYFWGN